MTLFSESITKIRRLVKDPQSKIITSDTPILNLIGRVQQEFARDSLCLSKVEELQAPSEIAFSITHHWEEGFTGSAKVMIPFLKDGTYSSSQPFELAGGYNLPADGYTVTCGDDVMNVDPQHDLPLFPGVDYYSPIQLFWNYKAIAQKSYAKVDEQYNDGWHYKGTEVDFFSHAQGTRRKALVTRSIPYAKPDDIETTGAQSLVGNTLRENMFILAYNVVPERPTATSDSFMVQEPFIKYIEYRVACRLLKSYYPLRNKEKALHLEFRYGVGVAIVKTVLSKQAIERSVRLGASERRRGSAPPAPRLPQHYPTLRVRR